MSLVITLILEERHRLGGPRQECSRAPDCRARDFSGWAAPDVAPATPIMSASKQMTPSWPELNPSPRLLLGPGPSNVHPRVLRACATPLLGHLDPEFLALMEETKQLLRLTFETDNPLTIPVSGTGSAGMDTCFVNVLGEGDEAVIGINGVFGTRMADVVERAGGRAIGVEAPWGQIIDPADIAKALGTCRRPKLVAVVHAETSTGVWQPLEDIVGLAHDAGALFLVDAVTSLGGCPVRVDAWGESTFVTARLRSACLVHADSRG